ncbi:aldo/keto reductase [Agromyces sp. CFH 90414]|uniref:Aldo/keto reductase n=1 Tax=Agromyces agglutinans TaxID=2662258 RepID=A0A6I2F532_9MICO|nr:aldo/keto reductase [Agromyces agglutinans]MRG59371.1 aldo/keto reductase [Agromyces agglutinans]
MTTIPLVLGAMKFGTEVDEDTAFALLDRFVEAGGTWIDTADCYSFWASESGRGGASERVLGRWLAARPGVRDRVLISTKVGAEPIGSGAWPASREGLSDRAIREAVAGSLDRLGIDRVDLLWAHMEDRSVPIEETAETFSALVADGMSSRLGASNHPAWRMERARAHAVAIGGTPFSALQLSRSYLAPRPGVLPEGQNHRFGMMSDEQVDFAVETGMELWAYTPLLSGAYDNPAKPIPEAHDHPGSTARLAALDAVAGEVGATRGRVVLAWLVGGGTPILPILGGSRPDQLDAALEGVALELTAEQRARLDAAA